MEELKQGCGCRKLQNPGIWAREKKGQLVKRACCTSWWPESNHWNPNNQLLKVVLYPPRRQHTTTHTYKQTHASHTNTHTPQIKNPRTLQSLLSVSGTPLFQTYPLSSFTFMDAARHLVFQPIWQGFWESSKGMQSRKYKALNKWPRSQAGDPGT